MTASDEVTAADIARIAGVGRAAVSNWRRRHPDFPRPVGGPPNSPTFSLTDVRQWLTANGRSMAAGDSASTDTVLPRAMVALLPPLAASTVLELVPSPSVEWDVPPGGVADTIISVAPTADLSTGAVLPAGIRTWEFGQPARGDQPLAWVQVCVAKLKPGGTAVVAVPFGVAVRASGRRIRAELLRTGVLTHVIGLPERLTVSGSSGPWQLWLLTRPIDRPAYRLRMVDLSGQAPEELPQTNDDWTTIFADPHRTRDLPAIELLDEDVNLVPTAYIAAQPRDIAPEYEKLRHRYGEVLHRLADAAPVFQPGNHIDAYQLVSISDLVRSGVLTFVDRSAARPGDVLIPARANGFEAFVAGPNEPTPPTGSVLRGDPEAIDPHFLACFLRAETNRRQASGTSSGTFRLDLRRARVPRMALAEQRHYGEAFRRLMEFAGAAEELAAAATAATRIAIDGLTTGAFTA